MPSWCQVCGSEDMATGVDGSFFCQACGTQNVNYIEEAFDGDDGDVFNLRYVRESRVTATRNQTQTSTPQSEIPPEFFAGSQAFASQPGPGENSAPPLGDVSGTPSGSQTAQLLSSQFGLSSQESKKQPIDKEELACSIRKSYVEGIQKILFLQCETLVKDFNVTPLICGIIGPLWLRYVASTRVFEKAWVDEAIEVAEIRERMRPNSRRRVFKESEGDPGTNIGAPYKYGGALARRKTPRKQKGQKRRGVFEPRTTYGKKARYVWVSALKERIPISLTLALTYLACHIARETILPTEISRWARKGKLPFLNAYIELSKPSVNHIPNTVGGLQTFPVAAKSMFRPKRVVGARAVELLAGRIAGRIGLQLPPVNYLALSSRFLHEMKLPVEKLLVYVYRMYEWYCPAGLWLTSLEFMSPTRVYVMAMIVIVLKVLYRLDGGAENHTPDREGATNATDLRTSLHNKDRDGADKDDSGDMEVDSKGANNLDADVTSQKRRDPEEEYLKVPGADVISPKFYKVGEVWDVKELLIHMKKMKPFRSESDTRWDNERELAEYLKYCRDVIHPGAALDADEVAMRDYFWQFYESKANESTENKERDESDEDVEDVLNRREEAEPGHLSDTVGRADNIRYSTQSHGSVGSVARVRNKVQSRQPSNDKLNMFDSSGRKIGKKHNEGQDNAMDADVKQGGDSKMEGFVPTEDTKCARKRELQRLLKEMKEFGFSCLPPLTKNEDPDHVYFKYRYLISDRFLKPVHEEYFIILRVCAKMIKVHPRALHWAVQKVERQLLQVEETTKDFMLSQDEDISSLYKENFGEMTRYSSKRVVSKDIRSQSDKVKYDRFRVHEGFASESEYTNLILHANYL